VDKVPREWICGAAFGLFAIAVLVSVWLRPSRRSALAVWVATGIMIVLTGLYRSPSPAVLGTPAFILSTVSLAAALGIAAFVGRKGRG
jgi:hypothetical protein